LTAGGEVVGFTSFENLSGLGDDDTFNMNAAVDGTVDGGDDGAGGDVINGLATANVFNISAANGGTVNGTTFAGVENLNGGVADDAFTFAAAGSLGGSIAGAGGDDDLDVSAAPAVTVNLGNSSATILNGGGADGFSSIESFAGNGTDDVLVGTGNADTFDTSGVNAGTVAGVTYTGFANLSGGAGDDVFNLQHNVGGNVDGGADADTFNLTDGVTIGGGINGGIDDDELVAIGGVGPNAWSVTATDAGALNGQSFSDVENLTGNDNVDNFTISAALSGTAAGQGGDDAFNIGGIGSAGSIDGGADSDSLSFAARTSGVTVDMADVNAVESLTGSGFDDTFNINGDEGNEITIAGGGGSDTVAVISASQIAGDLNISGVDSMSIGADLDAGANNVVLSVNGAITQSGAGGVLTAQSLSASSVGGQTLTTAVSSYTASNTGSGDISLDNNSAADLDVTGVSQTGGAISIETDGNLTQSGDITSAGGQINVTAGGAITMLVGTITNSNGGDITYSNDDDEVPGAGGDITLGTLQACDNCPTGGGAIRVLADGNIVGNPGASHVSAVSAWLSAGGDIGTETIGISFVGMDPSADAGDGEEIGLNFGGAAFIDEGLFSFTVTDASDASKVSAQGQASANVASADQAAAQNDEEDVDWAAFSEDVTVYEINNDGVQLPEGQQTDEFAKLDDLEKEETMSDVVAIFDGVDRPEGIPVSQLID